MRLQRVGVSLFILLAASGPAFGQTAVVGANFQTMIASEAGNVLPPDTMGGIGPNYWMQYNNIAVKFFDKAGNQIGTTLTEGEFWQNKVGLGSAAANASGDPRVMFDPLSGRWFATALTAEVVNGNLQPNNSLLLARSDTADPTGTWRGTVITQNTGRFFDQPLLGLDRNGLYIGGTTFNLNTGAYMSSIFSIPKADLLGNTPATYLNRMTSLLNQDPNTVGFAPQGVTNFNVGQATNAPGHIFAVDNAFFGVVDLTPINGPGGSGATLGTSNHLSVQATSFPTFSLQPNANKNGWSNWALDANDDRFSSVVSRVGNLIYSVHGIADDSSGGEGWVQIRVTILDVTNPTSPTVKAEGTIGGFVGPSGTQFDNFFDLSFPSIAANANGDIVIGYTRTGWDQTNSANSRWPSAYAIVGKLTGDTLTFGPRMELRAGNAPYEFGPSGSILRWGDYSTTVLDPADPGIFWTSQEYAHGSTEWGTQTTEIIPTVAFEKRWASISATNATGRTGNFSTAANWYGGIVPGANDHAIFSRNGDGTTPYTVTLDAGTTTNDRASVRQGNVVFNIPTGSTYSLTNAGTSTPSLAVAEYLGTANLTVSGSGTLQTVHATVAAGLNSEGEAATAANNFVGNTSLGSVTVDASTWTNTGDLYLGGSATAAGGLGTLNVLDGGTVNVGGVMHIWRDNGTTPVVSVGDASAAGFLNVGQLTNASGTAPVIDLANGGSLLWVQGNTDSTFGGVIQGSGSLRKAGTGTFTLTNTNTYTGGTVVNQGTLQLGADDVLPDSGPMNLNGGTLATNGFSDVVGPFELGNSSTLALGGGVHSVTFGGIVGTPTSVLTVTGWTGTGGESGTAGRILFTNVGTDPNTTYASFLSNVQFSGYDEGATFILDTGTIYELVPVPEPATVLGIAAGVLGLGGLLRRARRKPEPATAA